MKKHLIIISLIALLSSCKDNQNENSFDEGSPVYEGVENSQDDNAYILGDSTQNTQTITNENQSIENIQGEITQDSAVYEGVQEN